MTFTLKHVQGDIHYTVSTEFSIEEAKIRAQRISQFAPSDVQIMVFNDDDLPVASFRMGNEQIGLFE